LADTKVDNANDYQSYLNQFMDSSDLFYSLLFEDGATDRFSWFVDDYIALQQQFQGITKSFGMRYKAVQINNVGDVIIYVTYVSSNSPASNANIKRGDIFNAIDGTLLNTTNFSSVVSRLENETIKLSFVSAN